MKTTAKVAGVLTCAALVAALVLTTGQQDSAAGLAGIAAGMHFTNPDGSARMPTEEERAALAEAFQANIAELTRNRKMPQGSSRAASGAETAVVGAKSLRFLVVGVDENGQPTFDHAAMDEAGHIDTSPANELPEM
ncbi:MAG: hypothetical protein OEW35_03930 [Gammaproteobacteria bacterium]|nr:hypothetical protein [Gammaproteobacteria bacterium]MDH4253506.1 hypothetical protein [Gammaproteobacteria bacterium]MDH5309739.1 hypothetical protein [Gammaproteobacteria bacterium]